MDRPFAAGKSDRLPIKNLLLNKTSQKIHTAQGDGVKENSKTKVKIICVAKMPEHWTDRWLQGSLINLLIKILLLNKQADRYAQLM